MIEYLVAGNPDDRILKKASSVLKEGGLVVLPSDTSWQIMCDPFSKTGLSALYKIKNEGPLKHYSAFCDSISMASEIAEIHDIAFRMIRNKVPGHYTFIFSATKKMVRAVQASKSDREVGIRIPPCPMTLKVIETHGNTLLGTHIDHEFLGIDESEEIYSYLIEECLGNKIDLILDPGEYDFCGPSTIINFTDIDNIHLVRAGAVEFTNWST